MKNLNTSNNNPSINQYDDIGVDDNLEYIQESKFYNSSEDELSSSDECWQMGWNSDALPSSLQKNGFI